MSWDATTNTTPMDGGKFICVQMNPLSKLNIEPYGKNYQADTDALNKNYRGECEMFHKLAYQQM